MKNEMTVLQDREIRNKIYTVRGLQVMIDRDLAELYGVQTKILNKAVKRNSERFPESFCFKLDTDEVDSLRFQIGTIEKRRGGHTKYLPNAFTEQGVAMLAGVLRSETAVKISVEIIESFIEMRKFINYSAQIFQRLDKIDLKQIEYKIETDTKIDKVFKALENNDLIPKQGIFFEGQIFGAYKFVSDLFRSANKSVTIIDNYIDDTVLVHLMKVSKNVKVKILTKSISKQLKLDLEKFKNECFSIEIKVFKKSHDRFIIIDDDVIYHFGASLKDLGKKLFGFSKMEKSILNLLTKIDEIA